MSSIIVPPHGRTRTKAPGMTPRKRRLAALLLTAITVLSAPAQCQDAAQWDRARAELKASAPGTIAPAIARWRQLIGTENQGFDAYAGFLLAWPGFPLEDPLRRAAEKSLAVQNVDSARLVAFFDRFPPLTNPARAAYALALSAQGRERDAAPAAQAAWRGGAMSDAAESAILSRWGSRFTQDDHDARLEALLWDGAATQAARLLPRASLNRRALAQARIAIQLGQGTDADTTIQTGRNDFDAVASAATAASPIPAPAPATIPPELLTDPGYLADRARVLLRHNRAAEATALLASRPTLARPALDPRRWVATLLAAARAGTPDQALRIAATANEGFPPGTDISQLPFALRDDYTTLMWLGATQALWQMNAPQSAAPLFWRYATAARTPMTRAKGFYWSGRALAQAGQTAQATAQFASAAQYPDQYYGLLALERLGRPIPPLHDTARPQPTELQRAEFATRPIVQAVREVARDADWQTTIRFFREVSNQAKTEGDFTLVEDLAKSLGRRDLAVVAGQAAENAGLTNFKDLAFPLVPTPDGANWTFVHAIARQESQFSQNALSHTGARGLMQLMPATAAEQARRLGLPVSTEALFDDPAYNLALGNAFFARLLTYYHGSYPLAVAAYNAGPGNVNKWLASRGDPRQGNLDWVEWIERIPVSETRGYVAHVLENAVTYEAMNPAKASYTGPNPLSHYIGKDQPG